MSSRDSKEPSPRVRVFDWTCTVCSSPMSFKDQPIHLRGTRHADMVRAAIKAGTITIPAVAPEPPKLAPIASPAEGPRTKNFQEFIAEQKSIYKAKKGRLIAAAIEETRAMVATENAAAASPVPATSSPPRFAPGARFPSRPPDEAKRSSVAKKGGSKRSPKKAELSVAASKDKPKEAPKKAEPSTVAKERPKKVSEEASEDKSKALEKASEVSEEKSKKTLEKSKKVLEKISEKASEETRLATAVKTAPKRTPKVNEPISPVASRRGRVKKTPKEAESPAMIKNDTPKKERQDKPQPSPRALASATESSVSSPAASVPEQEPAVIPLTWCSACSIAVATNGFEAHLSDWNHLAITAAIDQLQIITQLEEKTESESAFFPSPPASNEYLAYPASTEYPPHTDCSTGYFEIQSFDEWPYVDDVSTTSQEAFSSVTDDIWTVLFQQSHQAGVKLLENLRRNKRQSSASSSRKYQLSRKPPRLHPDGNRRIKICQIPETYEIINELPTQAWLDAFIALPQGVDTLITPEEYELACDAFNSSGLVYNIDTQWGTVPLVGDYMTGFDQLHESEAAVGTYDMW